mmetsp:Transcript_46222/g.110162  ORF Transcript_46222/g.110162 Transcript_46222/m.110162 type:complete len:996 (-) Transcript_46222:84-3071(-)
MLNKLSIENINNQLVAQGVPGGELLSKPAIALTGDETPPVQPWVVVVAVLGLLLLVALIGRISLMRWRTTSRRLTGAIGGAVADQQDLPPSLRGKYRAQKVLGSGGSGVVLEACQITRRKRDLWIGSGGKQENVTAWRAVKLVHSVGRKLQNNEVHQLVREAALLGRINNRHVVHFYESGLSLDGKVFWIVMEKLDGLTLREVLKNFGPLNEVEAIKVGLEVCAGLKAIHQLQVIHRDLKPGNVMRAADGVHKIIDLGTALDVDHTAVPVPRAGSSRGASSRGRLSESIDAVSAPQICFAGTPVYASPENFLEGAPLSFASDTWSLSMTLFELVAGKLPFDRNLDAVQMGAVIAGDMEQPVADVRDVAPEEVRAGLSSAFAAVLATGLEKRADRRFQTADSMASTLYSCMVDGGEGSYSTFISYRVASEKFHAALLHEALNNTVTPAGHRVINYLDVKRLVSSDWEKGFSQGLLKSLVALPLVSAGFLEPMMTLTGGAVDRPDNVAKELQIMHAMIDSREDGVVETAGKLEAVYPILVGKPIDDRDKRTGNFFGDGSAKALGQLVEKVSPATTKAVEEFLDKSGVAISEGTRNRTVASTVSRLLALQGAQLWNHGELQPGVIAPDGEIWKEVQRAPPVPSLDLHQLQMLQAQLRNLVPKIHEVVDRAHADHMKRQPAVVRGLSFKDVVPLSLQNVGLIQRDFDRSKKVPMSGMPLGNASVGEQLASGWSGTASGVSSPSVERQTQRARSMQSLSRTPLGSSARHLEETASGINTSFNKLSNPDSSSILGEIGTWDTESVESHAERKLLSSTQQGAIEAASAPPLLLVDRASFRSMPTLPGPGERLRVAIPPRWEGSTSSLLGTNTITPGSNTSNGTESIAVAWPRPPLTPDTRTASPLTGQYPRVRSAGTALEAGWDQNCPSPLGAPSPAFLASDTLPSGAAGDAQDPSAQLGDDARQLRELLAKKARLVHQTSLIDSLTATLSSLRRRAVPASR